MMSSKAFKETLANRGSVRPERMVASCFYLADGDWGGASEANAGNKARNDVETVLQRMGLHRIAPMLGNFETDGSAMKKALRYRKYAQAIDAAIGELQDGAILFVQFPLTCHTPLFARVMRKHQKRGIRFVLLLHDVEMLRFGLSVGTGWKTKARIKAEEMSALRRADCLIVHNEAMAVRLNEIVGIPLNHMVCLGIFDYLNSHYRKNGSNDVNRFDPVVVAGNLSREKAGYLYEKIDGIAMVLYGVGYDDAESPSITYRGKADPDELPGMLAGSFGLVWDGPSQDGCKGAFGEYLRVNNPHKTSLYLAAGIPVIIWNEAALAPFVKERGVGLCVAELRDIPAAIAGLSDVEYQEMRSRAADVGSRISSGQYVETAVIDAVKVLEGRG